MVLVGTRCVSRFGSTSRESRSGIAPFSTRPFSQAPYSHTSFLCLDCFTTLYKRKPVKYSKRNAFEKPYRTSQSLRASTFTANGILPENPLQCTYSRKRPCPGKNEIITRNPNSLPTLRLPITLLNPRKAGTGLANMHIIS